MKVVLAGGTGQVGQVLQRHFAVRRDEVVVLSRSSHTRWDGRTLGPWAKELDGADLVINLAGRSVSCRYTKDNLAQMLSSRVDSARVVGEAIEQCATPPRLWLQMSTATIYADTRGPAHDESGELGGHEPGVPPYWEFSVRIARDWEAAQQERDLPGTRRIALRAAMVMSPDRGGVFDVLSKLVPLGLAGPVAGGGQYVSWIHDQDFCRVVDHLVASDLEGPVNVCSPEPLPQKELMRVLKRARGHYLGLPATRWMAELGAWAMRSDTELLLKSRRVVPRRLLEDGFVFDHPAWPEAAMELLQRGNA